MLRSITLLIALILATQTFADTRDERLELATKYVKDQLADMDMAAVIQQMWKPLADQAAAQGSPLSDDKKAKLDALYQKTFTEPMYDIMLRQSDVMADLYSIEEIRALYEFYQTELGRSAMTKLPKLIEAQQPMILEMVQREINPILPEIQAIMTE